MSRRRSGRNAREGSSAPRVIVQVIVVTWTKRARGGSLATRRNAVPERLALPEDVAQRQGDYALFSQTVTFDESNDFAAPIAETVRTFDDIPVPLGKDVYLSLHDDILSVAFRDPAPYVPRFPPDAFRDYHGPDRKAPVQPAPMTAPGTLMAYRGMGAPARPVPATPLALRLGEWGQFRYLGRHSATWDGPHVYKKYVYNVGWLWDVSTRVFVDTEPHRRYASMPDVW